MKNFRLKIFCDFDGTITKNDVWVNSLGKFISDKNKFKEICYKYYSDELNIRECIKSELELVENFSYEKFNEYLDEEEIDHFFKDFLEYCKVSEIDFYIVSAGLDYYIKYILDRENIDSEFYACKMIFDEISKKLDCEFTYSDEYCRSCGACKRNILISRSNDLENEISVFIGDGESDFCVSSYADIVFAKGKLASYCWKNNITYFEYKDFSDIKKKIIKIINRKNIKHRQESKNRRRDVVMGG